MLSLLLFLSALTAARAEPFTLISGFDDVLRQAENQNLLKAGLKLFKDDRTFTAMPELYVGLTDGVTQNEKFSLISGMSSFFQNRVEKFIRKNGFPTARIYLRSWIREWSIGQFKLRSIRRVVGDDPAKKFIVVFDNSGPSLEMVKTIPESFPGRVLQIYLRETVQRPKVEGAQQFVTAFDIALSEMKAGRLKEAWVKIVAQTIVAETDSSLLLPEYVYCPVDYDPCAGGVVASVSGECSAVREKVRLLCRSRVVR